MRVLTRLEEQADAKQCLADGQLDAIPRKACRSFIGFEGDCACVDGQPVSLRLSCSCAVADASLCGSGFQTAITAAQTIALGEAEVCLTGGAEAMSMSPYTLAGASR